MSKTATKKATKKPVLEHMVTIVMGDWSDDGHGKTERATIRCNKTRAAMEKAYEAGVKLCGVDLSEEVAADYQDGGISLDQLKKLQTAGVPLLEDLVKEATKASDKEANLNRDLFLYIWLEIVKLGAPDFEYKHVKESAVTIGGYGLFY